MPLMRPTSGVTYCSIYTGHFSQTYDDNIATGVYFDLGQTCLSEWTWSEAVSLTGIRIYTVYYNDIYNNYLQTVFGLKDGRWVEIWSGTLHFPYGQWYDLALACDNCKGIRFTLMHNDAWSHPSIREIKINYEEMVAEGKAVIAEIDRPSTFTPGVPFNITSRVRNDGGDDVLFVKIVDRDTGVTLKDFTSPFTVGSGQIWGHTMVLTLTQVTDFHGRVEAGHEE